MIVPLSKSVLRNMLRRTLRKLRRPGIEIPERKHEEEIPKIELRIPKEKAIPMELERVVREGPSRPRFGKGLRRVAEEEIPVKTVPVLRKEPEALKKEKKPEEKVKIKEKKSLVVEFTKMGYRMRKGVLDIKEIEKGGVRGAPLGMRVPKEVSKKISSEWEPPKLDQINIKYPLIEPFAYSTIRWNEKLGELAYIVIEPPLTKKEEKTLNKIKTLIVDLLDINLMDIKNIEEVEKYLKGKLNQIISDYEIAINEAEYNKILYYIYRNFLGLEKIEPLMRDLQIEDISCDGVNIPIFVYHRKYGSLKTNILYDDSDKLNMFITKLAQRCGKHISVAEPLLEGALPDGSRLQATFSAGRDIAMRGSTFTIRKFTKDPLTIVDFMNFGTLPPRIAAYLWMAIEFRNSILVAGGTATGKTSALNCLSLFLPPEAKIVSIEDTPELRLPHEHWIAKVARTGYGAAGTGGRKRGEITMFDLLRAALRERPDELIVGEVRGQEAYVLFQGMATGHAGLATIHAESVEAVVNRLKTPPINLSGGLLQHLDIIIIMGFSRIKGIDVRRIKEVVEVIGVDMKTEKPITNRLFRWVPAGDYFEFASDRSYVLDKIIREKGIPEQSIWEELNRRSLILDWMKKQNIRYYKDVGRIVAAYYKNPEEILKKIGI